MTEFETYQPEAWFYDGLIVASDFDKVKPDTPTEKRSSPWGIELPRALIGAGVIAGTLLFGATTAAASSIDAIPFQAFHTPAFLQSPRPAALSPLKQINRDFNSLFDSMRSGAKVLALGDMRELAKKAVQNRDEKVDVQAWAQRLADDVKDAND